MQKSSKIAFLIAAHHDADLLMRLCQHMRDHAVFLHVDAKSVHFPVDRFRQLPHVTVVPARHSVHWADFSQVEATLEMLRAATKGQQAYCKYVLLSGACYPVKPLSELARTFAEDGGKNYVRFTRITRGSALHTLIGRRWRMAPLLSLQGYANSHPLVRAERLARDVVNKLSSAVPRHFETEIGMPAYYGSNWWALSDGAVRCVLDRIQQNPALLKPFRSVYAVDEIFFHTLLANTPFFENSEGLQDDMAAGTNQYAPLHMIHPSEARVFGRAPQDLELAQGSGKFFVRKVSSRDSAALLDRIDVELLHPAAD